MTRNDRQDPSQDGHLHGTRVVLAAGNETPAALLAAAEAALLALDIQVKVVASERSSMLGKALAALGSEVLARRLERELVGPPLASVALALDLPAAAALGRERTRGVPVPVIALCTELAPRAGWATRLDRIVAIDDEAAVALGDLGGVDSARVTALGAPAGRAWIDQAERPRAEVRQELNLDPAAHVVTIDCAGLGAERLSQLLVQLAMLDAPPRFLFDSGGEADVANQLRRQVPSLGLAGKLVNDVARVPAAWRAADCVLTHGGLEARLRALAVGAGLIMVDAPAGELGEARALADRGAGIALPLLGASTLVGDGPRLAAMAEAAAQVGGIAAGADPLARVAELCLSVARSRDAVLAEPFVDGGAAAPEGAPAAREPAGLEDLGSPQPSASRPAAPPRDREAEMQEAIRKMKEKAAQKAASVDDALAALKNKMKGEGKK